MADRIDLNCDLGEELDPWAPGVDGLDTLLLDVVTSANVACGFHAGDERIMAAVCRAAAARGVASARTCPTSTASTSAAAFSTCRRTCCRRRWRSRSRRCRGSRAA